MAWQLTEDLGTYLAAAGGFLRAHPAQNTIMLTAAEAIRVRGPGAFGGPAPLFGWHAELAGRGREVPGVNATGEPGSAFAAAWQEHTGQPARTAMRMRLYALAELLPPDPPPPGQPRIASAADRDLLLAWLNAFHAEAGPEGPNESERVVDDRVGNGGLILWEHEGRPVSVAGRNRPAAGQARVGPVYTPPDLRGRGFGGAATAAITQAALDDGAEGVVLFTDLANLTSNTLYQRLGYRPVSDWAVLRFGRPER